MIYYMLQLRPKLPKSGQDGDALRLQLHAPQSPRLFIHSSVIWLFLENMNEERFSPKCIFVLLYDSFDFRDVIFRDKHLFAMIFILCLIRDCLFTISVACSCVLTCECVRACQATTFGVWKNVVECHLSVVCQCIYLSMPTVSFYLSMFRTTLVVSITMSEVSDILTSCSFYFLVPCTGNITSKMVCNSIILIYWNQNKFQTIAISHMGFWTARR